MSNTIPTTTNDYYKNISERFMGGFLFGEQEAIDEACDTCDCNDLHYEAGDFRPEDINLMVDMCRIDRNFSTCCNGDPTDLEIDTLDFILLAWHRVARLAHTFWGIQSHFAALGVEPNEDLSVDFVKRAVSQLIKEENTKRGESADFEKARIAELNAGQAE